MLEPLRQWICDACGQIISAPDHGFVEWKETDRGKKYGFRIVHNAKYSPRKDNGGDCFYSHQERGGDLYLERIIGLEGLVTLTSWIDVGEWHHDDYPGPSVLNLREWVTLVRRVQLPHYEQARFCTDALSEPRDCELNEYAFYLPEQLKRIIEAHENRNAMST